MYRCVVTDSSGKSVISDEATLYVLADDCEVKTASIATDALPLCGIPVESGGNYTDSNGQQWIADELIYNADGTGKIVKRILEMTFDGSSDEAWNLLSDNRFGITVNDVVYPPQTSNKADIISDSFVRLTADKIFNDTSAIGLALNPTNKIMYCRVNSSISTIETFRDWLQSNAVKILAVATAPQKIELTAAEVGALRTLQTFDGVTNISNSAGAEMSVKYCTNKALSEYVLPITKGLQAQIDELRATVFTMNYKNPTLNESQSGIFTLKRFFDNIIIYYQI